MSPMVLEHSRPYIGQPLTAGLRSVGLVYVQHCRQVQFVSGYSLHVSVVPCRSCPSSRSEGWAFSGCTVAGPK